MMKKPEGIAGDPVFMVQDMPIGRVHKAYYSLDTQTPLPATVSVRVERCKGPAETVDHDRITDYLDFGITTNVWNPERVTVLFPAPGLAKLNELAEPFTAAKLAKLIALARWHQNSLQDYCVHQVAPSGPRGRRPDPCGVTGYKYGALWLVRPLPPGFLKDMREVFADADPDRIYDSREDA